MKILNDIQSDIRISGTISSPNLNKYISVLDSNIDIKSNDTTGYTYSLVSLSDGSLSIASSDGYTYNTYAVVNQNFLLAVGDSTSYIQLNNNGDTTIDNNFSNGNIIINSGSGNITNTVQSGKTFSITRSSNSIVVDDDVRIIYGNGDNEIILNGDISISNGLGTTTIANSSNGLVLSGSSNNSITITNLISLSASNIKVQGLTAWGGTFSTGDGRVATITRGIITDVS